MPRRNLVLNPSFETSVDKWTATGAETQTNGLTLNYRGDTGTPQGTNYAFTTAVGGDANVRPTDLVPVTPGQRYTLSGWAYRPNGTVRVDIDWYNAANGYLSSSSVSFTVNNAWVRVTTSGVAPANAAKARPWFAYLSLGAGQTIGLDGVLFEPSASATAGTYFDGNTPGFRWEGSAHASFSTDEVLVPAALAAPTTPTPGRRNLAENPSAETSASGYSSYSNATSIQRVAYTGGAYAVRWATTSAASTAIYLPSADVVAGGRYTASVYLHVHRATSGRLALAWYDSGGGFLSTTFGTNATRSVGWTRIDVVDATAPAGAVTAYPYVYLSTGLVAQDLMWVDRLLVEESTTLQSYFDGDTDGADWEGTPHSSPSIAGVVDLREGHGYASVGLSAAASGAKKGTGSGAARIGLAASAAGTARRESHGEARLGLSGMAAGVKTGIGTGWSPPIGLEVAAAGAKLAHGLGLAPPIGLGAYATAPAPVPQFTGRPLPEDPLPLAQSRYLVQNILTGRWLHTDLPLSNDTVKRTLSGPCEIAGDITPEYADLRDEDGGPLLRSWGHVIYLEMDGEVRAAGLITEDSYDDQTQSLVCQGVSAYPAQIAYQGGYRRYFADPITVAQQMWTYVQGFQNGNLGVQVTRAGGVPPVLYGAKVSPVPGDTLLGLKYAERPAGSDNDQDPPTLPVAYANTLPAVWDRLLAMGYRGKPDDQQEALYVRKADLERAYTDYFLTPGQPHGLTMQSPPDRTSSVTIEPFRVDWWDVKKCGEIIDEAVKALPGDYVEQYGWNFQHTFVDQRVLFSYPRLGRRREDLRFVQGENIVQPVRLESDPDGFATCVVGIGAGEGSAALREQAEVIIPGLVRKTYVYRNTKITDRTTLRRLVTDELLQRSTGGYDIPSTVVQASHPNAAFGSYSEGDDIYVQADVPGYGWIGLWCRIMSMTLSRGTDLVEIALRRSDSFYYGREVEST